MTVYLTTIGHFQECSGMAYSERPTSPTEIRSSCLVPSKCPKLQNCPLLYRTFLSFYTLSNKVVISSGNELQLRDFFLYSHTEFITCVLPVLPGILLGRATSLKGYKNIRLSFFFPSPGAFIFNKYMQ